MNRKEQIAVIKAQLEIAKTTKSVALQMFNQAAHLESSLQSSLDELGASPERARKGKELSEESKMMLLGNLTNRGNRAKST